MWDLHHGVTQRGEGWYFMFTGRLGQEVSGPYKYRWLARVYGLLGQGHRRNW